MSESKSYHRGDVHHEIGQILRAHRPNCHPNKTAQELLRHDTATQQLVGIRWDGKRAIFHRPNPDEIIAVKFDTDGIDDRGGLVIGVLDNSIGIEIWVMKFRHYLGWIHPRYQ